MKPATRRALTRHLNALGINPREITAITGADPVPPDPAHEETPMTDQFDLRDRIANAIGDFMARECTICGSDYEAADAVLAVLPAPTDRAAVLLEAADIAESLRQFQPAYEARKSAQISENVGIVRVADRLRRLAREARQDGAPR